MFKLIKSLRKRDYLYILGAVAFIVIQVWLDLTLPDYTAKLTTEISKTGEIAMSVILKNGLMMVLCALGSMLSAFACGFCTVRDASSFSYRTRERMFAKITSFTSVEMKKFSTPSLITRTTNDINQVHMFLAMGMQMLIKAPVLAIWAICKISASSTQWTMATGICVGIILCVVAVVVSICLPKFKKIQSLTDNLNKATRESVSGVRVVRAFNAESYQEAKFNKANDALVKSHLFTSRTMGIMMPVISTCMNGLSLAIYWIGAYLINDAPITSKAVLFGNMVSFTQYAIQVVMAFMMLIMIFIVLPRAIVSAKRINEVLDFDVVIKDGSLDNINLDKVGEVEFKKVDFRYFDGSNDCLSDVSFKINRGETVAIIGATGSGKTTIIDLIPRFYDATSGEVVVDGINVRDMKIEDLQKRIAVVSQKAVLFKGDIRSNIIYGSDDNLSEKERDEKINNALRIAKADFVFELDNGLDAPVAQGGTNFSGGQKQRLSIARAIYKDAGIIIFDDSFSALDFKTDMEVRQNIKEHLSDKTIIIVAQRIGTIKNADKIIVLDEGRVVGEGKHSWLMENCEIYKEIALSQLSKEEL